jgi:hypothetical protein
MQIIINNLLRQFNFINNIYGTDYIPLEIGIVLTNYLPRSGSEYLGVKHGVKEEEPMSSATSVTTPRNSVVEKETFILQIFIVLNGKIYYYLWSDNIKASHRYGHAAFHYHIFVLWT